MSAAFTEQHPPAPRMQRPRCACCGKPYGSRSTDSVTLRSTEGPPVYRGNGYVIKVVGGPNGMGEWVLYFHVWDGESLRTPYRPFCTLRCAWAFADCAHEAGFRVKGGAP